MRAFECRVLLAAALIASFAASVQVANASAITGITAGSPQTNGGNFSDASGSAAAAPGAADTFINPFSGNYHGGDTPPLHANYVNLTANVTNLGQTISETTTLLDNLQSSLYYYTVTMTNSTGKPIQPVTFKLVNSTVNAAKFADPTFGFNYTEAPTSSYQPWSDPAGLTSKSLTFGGLSGGGGELFNGQVATFHFSLYIPNSGASGNFFLQMTPNPEPGSLALAGLAGVGGLFLKRRRNTSNVVC